MGVFEKDLRLIGRVPETRGEILEGTITQFKHGGEGWTGETEVVRGANFNSRLVQIYGRDCE